MDKWLDKSNKTWLISLALLIGLSSVSAGSLSHSPTHTQQTEVAIRPSSIKATRLFSCNYAQKIAYYSGDLCFTTRIHRHTQHAFLKLKNRQPDSVVKSSALGHSHLKKLNTKEDTILPGS